MQKIEFQNEIYYYHNNRFLDSMFIEVDENTAKELAKEILLNIDYSEYSSEGLRDYIIDLKEAGLYKSAKDACLYGIDKYPIKTDFLKVVIPILTSCLRGFGNPEEAIKVAMVYLFRKEVHSVPYFTSLAAAYCDIKDYSNALKYANRGYATQGGGTGERNELSLVYRRIKREMGENNV